LTLVAGDIAWRDPAVLAAPTTSTSQAHRSWRSCFRFRLAFAAALAGRSVAAQTTGQAPPGRRAWMRGGFGRGGMPLRKIAAGSANPAQRAGFEGGACFLAPGFLHKRRRERAPSRLDTPLALAPARAHPTKIDPPSPAARLPSRSHPRARHAPGNSAGGGRSR
jgi:hypothetical protein